MLHQSKDFYRGLKLPNGYEWGGAGDLPFTHFFQSGNYRTGFKVMECSEVCLSNGDAEFMATHEMTCTKERLAELSAECIKIYGKGE